MRALDYRSFASDGLEIAYVDQGEGLPVLLIHGFASNIATNWGDTGWIGLLVRNGYRVIAIDNRGHGRSAKPHDEARYGARIMAGDAARLLDHLGIAKADVMGYSMGARITAFLAMEQPQRVRSAIFAGLGYNMIRGVGGARPIAHALRAPSIDDVTNDTARSFRAFAEQTGSDLEALAACILSSREQITAEAIGQLRMPVLVAVGSEDVIGGSAAGLAELIPGAEVLDITGRDHMRAVGDRIYKDGVVAFLARRG